MSKEEWKLYGASLVLTLLFFGFVMAFLFVNDQESIKRGTTPEEVFSLNAEDSALTLHALGRELRLDLQPIEQSAQFRREYAPLFTPRGLLTLECAVDYISYWGNQYYEDYQEQLFLKETAGG